MRREKVLRGRSPKWECAKRNIKDLFIALQRLLFLLLFFRL